MRRSVLRLLLMFLVTRPLLAREVQRGCSATPEAAAESAIGSGMVDEAAVGRGFRVQDVQVDAVLRRVWMRVRRCDDAAAPALLVPVAAPMEMAQSIAMEGPTAPAMTVSPVMLVHTGDVVRAVFDSSTVHMALEATANQQGAVGDSIQLTLRRRTNPATDEPEQRMHGIVRADKSVEVQP